MPKHQTGSALVILLIVVFLILATGGGYYLGTKKPDSQTIPTENTIPTPSPILETVNTNQETFENKYTQEFMYGENFSFNYTADKDTEVSVVNGKDSGWPISPLELTLNPGVTVLSSREYEQIQVGLSDTDPSVCLKPECRGGLESVTKIETASVSGILSKKVEGTAYGGGGSLPLGGPPPITLYVVPFQNKFFIITAYPETLLEKTINTFELW